VEGRLYLRLLLRNWVPLAVIAILALAAAAGLYASAQPTYQTKLTFTVQSNAASNDPSQIYQAELLSQARTQTYLHLITGPGLADKLQGRVGQGVDRNRLQHDVRASAAQGAVLLQVTVTDHSNSVADAIGAALVAEFPSYVANLQPTGERVTSVQLAAAPGAAQRTGPTKTRYLGLGLLAGLVLGLLVAIVREATNRRLRDVDDVRAVVGSMPVVVDLGRSGLRARRSAGAAVQLSVLIIKAAVNRRPIALIPLRPGRQAARGMLDFALRLSAQGDRAALLDGDVVGRHLSTAADADARVDVHHLSSIVGARPRQEVSGVQVVDAASIAELAPNSATAGADPDTIGAAIIKAGALLGDQADVVLVATGSVLLRSRPPFLSSEVAETVVLVDRWASKKSELRTATDVLLQLGLTLQAVVIAGPPPRRL
jgi:succinoglycan biosynthesis transport protein ExoP